MNVNVQKLCFVGSQPQEPACYGGKWTVEEEEYFHALREEFRAGTLDIPNGTTLRYFLAKKLGCKPKRITKKVSPASVRSEQYIHMHRLTAAVAL